MSNHRFVFSPAAIKDFREIFQSEKFSRPQALQELTKSSHQAQLQRTNSSGSRIYRAQKPREYYLLADPPGPGGDSKVRALASTQESNLWGGANWWGSEHKGDVEPEIDSAAGKELTFARKALGLSVTELAGLLHISPRSLRAWEKCTSRHDTTKVRRIARIVGQLHEARVLAYAMRNPGAAQVHSVLTEIFGRPGGLPTQQGNTLGQLRDVDI